MWSVNPKYSVPVSVIEASTHVSLGHSCPSNWLDSLSVRGKHVSSAGQECPIHPFREEHPLLCRLKSVLPPEQSRCTSHDRVPSAGTPPESPDTRAARVGRSSAEQQSPAP